MPGEFPPQVVDGTQEAMHAEEEFDAQQFLDGLGIGGLAEQPMLDHEGNVTTLAAAMRDCAPARASVEVQVETFVELGVDPVRGIGKHLEKMSKKAHDSAPEFRAAKKKLNNEQELTPNPEENHRTTPETHVEIEKKRAAETPTIRPVRKVTVPVQEIIRQQEKATRDITKKTDVKPTETVVHAESPIKKPSARTEILKTKVKPEIKQKIAIVKSIEPKPILAIVKPQPQQNRIFDRPTIVAEQKTKPAQVRIKEEVPIAKTHNPPEILYSAEPDLAMFELPEIEIQEPALSVALTDYEYPADDMETFIQPKTTFEQPDLELLGLALPFIEFQQPDLEAEFSDTEEETPGVVDQLNHHFETLEPELALEAGEILNMIMEKIQELEAEEAGEYRETLEQELEIICQRMLVCMGVEPAPEVVKNLLLVLKIEHQKQLKLNTQISYDAGTHERKNAVFQAIYDLPTEINQKLSHSLGRHTLILAS